ncbi:MAG: sulfatase-like hydrolase/transferase [Luteolibacter sp.]
MKRISMAFQFVTLLACMAVYAAEQPNIIHIIADDLGWKDVGFNGCTDIKTSNIDIDAQDASKPFYLYLTFNAPHTPYQAPQEYIDRYKSIQDPTRRIYAGMVACLDDEIGHVISALDKKGLRENTFILFHSDNGEPALPIDEGFGDPDSDGVMPKQH